MYSRLNFLVILLLGIPSCGQESSLVPVRLINEFTGFAVPVGASQDVVPAPTTEGAVLISANASGRVLNIPGYVPFTISAEAASRVPTQVGLRPVELPPQLRAGHLHSLAGPNSSAIVGFVSDGLHGTPLAGATVKVLFSGSRPVAQVTTDTSGYFEVPIQLGVHNDPSASTVDVIFLKAGFKTSERKNVELYANNVRRYRIRMDQGTGAEIMDEARENGTGTPSEIQQAIPSPAKVLKMPLYISVGRDCLNIRNCKTITRLGIEDYVKHVLVSEWRAGWNEEALKAGAVAVRTYGIWRMQHPLTSKYDICSSDACQVFDPDRSDSRTDEAVEATSSMVLVDSSEKIAFAEFSAENNNAGCGEGMVGNKSPQSPCISDPVCRGSVRAGHGRGMCQNGSERWASGKDKSGNMFPGGSRDAMWILSHYYPQLSTANAIDILSGSTP